MSQPSPYWSFIQANTRFLLFGFLMTLGSSFGQSFFIGVFQMPLRDEFGLSASSFGWAYFIATMGSAAALPWTGKLIDRISLPKFALSVLLFYGAACLVLSATNGFLMLVVALFMLRHGGQGLSTHTSSTSMARTFTKNRGKAVSLSAMGFSAGEATFPILAVMCLAALGWRASWLLIAAVLLLFFLPVIAWLLRVVPEVEQDDSQGDQLGDQSGDQSGAPTEIVRHWTRPEVLRDVRFYLLMPAMMAPPFILTGFFLHQGFMAESKGWPLEMVAIGFSVFAGVKLVAALYFGTLADRIGARVFLLSFLGPMAASMLALALFDTPYAIFIYFALAALATAAEMTVGNILWPSLYGTEHLGAIRSLVVSLMVLATGMAPAGFGWLIDRGFSAGDIAGISCLYIFGAFALVVVFLIRERRAF